MGSEVLAGRYVLGEILAAGGMAVVHLGTRIDDDACAPVAIKRLHRHLLDQTEFVAMFLDEARLTKRLGHPSIARTLDVVFGEHELFLVMDYLEGETLAALRKGTRARGVDIPVPLAARIVHDALEGLGAAHETRDGQGKLLGVVHRDFSPANLMVCTDGRSRVLDFGVAKAEGRLASTQAGALKGKIAYMAPEQLLGGEVDCRADLFAVGILFWELLTVRRAYGSGDNDAGIIARVIAPDFPAPSTLRMGVSPALDAVAAKALAPSPGDRFASAEEMAAAIAAATVLAPREEVAALVTSVCEDVLSKRRDSVLALRSLRPAPTARGAAESSSSPPLQQLSLSSVTDVGPPATAGDATRASHPDDVFVPTYPRWPAVVGLVLVAVVLLGWAASRRDPSVSSGGVPSALAAGGPAVGPSSAATASASSVTAEPTLGSAVASSVPAPSAALAPSSAPPSTGVPTSLPAGRANPAAKKSSCAASPYTKGAGGILRVRPECL